jgi:hypothetical protein
MNITVLISPIITSMIKGNARSFIFLRLVPPLCSCSVPFITELNIIFYIYGGERFSQSLSSADNSAFSHTPQHKSHDQALKKFFIKTRLCNCHITQVACNAENNSHTFYIPTLTFELFYGNFPTKFQHMDIYFPSSCKIKMSTRPRLHVSITTNGHQGNPRMTSLEISTLSKGPRRGRPRRTPRLM